MIDLRATQRGRILELLIASRGDWVPLPEITNCASQYDARIFELRRLGFRITNRTKEVKGVRHSWFRLEPGITSPDQCSGRTENVATPEQSPLFALPEMERTARWEDNG